MPKCAIRAVRCINKCGLKQYTFLPHVSATYGHHPIDRLIVEDITRFYIREYRPSQLARWYKQLSTTRH